MTMNSISTAMELFSYTGVSISLLTVEQTLVLTVVEELSRIMRAMIVNTTISIKPKVEAISITPKVEHFTYCSTSHDVS